MHFPHRPLARVADALITHAAITAKAMLVRYDAEGSATRKLIVRVAGETRVPERYSKHSLEQYRSVRASSGNLRAVHYPPVLHVEWIAPVHGAAVIPQQQIADFP